VLGLIAGVVFGTALVVFVTVLDVGLVVRAYEGSESSTLPAVVIGAAAALATVCAVVWYRRRVDRLSGTARRVLGWAGIAWAASFVVAYLWTHPKGRDDELATPLEVGVICYVLVIVVAAVVVFPFAVRRLARPRGHRPRDRVHVWNVADGEPSFVPACECGWVGSAYDAAEPEARDKAFRDARRHGTNVASDVERALA
jgi:cytochrome bd-type quinol oxidase subunit 2